MKRFLTLTLLLALCLTACAAPDVEAPPVESSAVQASAPEDGPEVQILADEGRTDVPEEHTLSEGGNVIGHEEALYCGNTVTTVTREEWAGGEPWTVSFWGSDSVALTDLLRFLDYSGDVCRCLPEYTVDTEFGEGYGVNLSDGYARYDGGQTALTAEQVELIQGILDSQTAVTGFAMTGGAASENP